MREFYRINQRGDGLVDIWLTPGDAVPRWDLNGRLDFSFRILAVHGVDPEDPQWGGDLEGHIRKHYNDWCAAAEVIEL